MSHRVTLGQSDLLVRENPWPRYPLRKGPNMLSTKNNRYRTTPTLIILVKKEGCRMVSFNLKVLAKFGLCSNCSQKLTECSLARARKIFATARMLTFSFKCDRLLEISLVLLCSYFLYINDISVVTRLRQKG